MSVRAPLPTLQLPRGEWLYHGTSAVELFHVLRAPAFLTRSRNAARWYAQEGHNERDPARGIPWGGRPRVLLYRLRRGVRLLHVQTPADMRKLAQAAGLSTVPEDPREFPQLWRGVCALGVDGWLIENGALGDDILLCRPDAARFFNEQAP